MSCVRISHCADWSLAFGRDAMLIVANWKMNGMLAGCKTYFEALQTNSTVVICPPFPLLQVCCELARCIPSVEVGAQNCHWEQEGAFTGEVSAKLLAELGVSWVLVGHSERRLIFGESNEVVSKKARAAFESGLGVVLCIGEGWKERESNQTMQVLRAQLSQSLRGVVETDSAGKYFINQDLPIDPSRLVIAYEPVWAIGTGKVADAEEVDLIHQNLKSLFAFPIQVLYGGSCNGKNAANFSGRSGIDGLLVGGASLDAHSFSCIIQAMAAQ